MQQFYCPECKTKLGNSKVRAKIISIVKDSGNGSPTFCNKSKYYCMKHNPPVEVEIKKTINI